MACPMLWGGDVQRHLVCMLRHSHGVVEQGEAEDGEESDDFHSDRPDWGWNSVLTLPF